MKALTFRQIFITLCILMFANLCVNVFQGSTTKADTVVTPLTHDGNCVCDGMDLNCPESINKDFQLKYQYNGDIIIYTVEDGIQYYVGTYKHGSKCDLQAIMDEWISNND